MKKKKRIPRRYRQPLQAKPSATQWQDLADSRHDSFPVPTTVDQEVAQGVHMPYDEDLLEQVRTHWQFGDWDSLTRLQSNTVQHHPDRPRLALLAAAGHAQLGHMDEAHEWLRLAQEWGCNRTLISRVLLSGVHNSLGRAAAVSGLPSSRAWDHFQAAIGTGMPGVDSELLLHYRTQGQLEQLHASVGTNGTSLLTCTMDRSAVEQLMGKEDTTSSANTLFALAKSLQQAGCLAEADSLLARVVDLDANRTEAWVAYAECAMRREDLIAAIRRWQTVASLMGGSMPQDYYDRLNEAYQKQKSFPLASAAEEALKGDGDKHELLTQIHQQLAPAFYLEIGVQTGKSLALAQCPALGIDPMPQLRFPLPSLAEVVECTSDDFFASHTDKLREQIPDLAFIDGMHLFEFALRDFINVERHASPHTLVVIDDILPGHPAQADRTRRTRAWTGDVWKLHAILQARRPDLFLLCLDAYPTGLLLIAGLDPDSRSLEQAYPEIVAQYRDQEPVPPAVIDRKQALSCRHPLLIQLIDLLHQARKSHLDRYAVLAALQTLR